MLSLTQTGRLADVVREIRDIPERVIPYAAATALTRTAKVAQAAVAAEMPRVFDRPIAYTRNSLRVKPATREAQAARLMVKDDAPNNGTRPENYLFPEIYAGPRKAKRFEIAMRYAGLLQRGEFAVLGQKAPLDDAGNLRRGEMQRILTATRSAFDPYQRKTDSRRSKANARKAPYFGARIGKTWGVWKRDGRHLSPILIFVRKAPQYRGRLPFEALAQTTAEREFPALFRAAADSILRRRAG